jgi:hypothetical protein
VIRIPDSDIITDIIPTILANCGSAFSDASLLSRPFIALMNLNKAKVHKAIADKMIAEIPI